MPQVLWVTPPSDSPVGTNTNTLILQKKRVRLIKTLIPSDTDRFSFTLSPHLDRATNWTSSVSCQTNVTEVKSINEPFWLLIDWRKLDLSDRCVYRWRRWRRWWWSEQQVKLQTCCLSVMKRSWRFTLRHHRERRRRRRKVLSCSQISRDVFNICQNNLWPFDCPVYVRRSGGWWSDGDGQNKPPASQDCLHPGPASQDCLHPGQTI